MRRTWLWLGWWECMILHGWRSKQQSIAVTEPVYVSLLWQGTIKQRQSLCAVRLESYQDTWINTPLSQVGLTFNSLPFYHRWGHLEYNTCQHHRMASPCMQISYLQHRKLGICAYLMLFSNLMPWSNWACCRCSSAICRMKAVKAYPWFIRGNCWHSLYSKDSLNGTHS